MTHYQIKSCMDGSILYSGQYTSFCDCLEQAITQNAILTHADLRHQNLSNANLDSANLQCARFDYSNLQGANLSEARLQGATFTNAALQNTCLAFSSLNDCDFKGASFGATDISGALLINNVFDTFSALQLNFIDAEIIENCLYLDANDTICPFSRPPVVILGMEKPIVFFDHDLKVGNISKRYGEWFSSSNDNIPDPLSTTGHIYSFFQKYKHLFASIAYTIRAHPRVESKKISKTSS